MSATIGQRVSGIQRYDVSSVLRPATILLVVPPFAALERPVLGVHLLQAIARERGVAVQILYANLLFAAFFDEKTHISLARGHYSLFLGERLFCRAAFDLPPLGYDGGAPIDPAFAAAREEFARKGLPFTMSQRSMLAIEARISTWLATFVPALAAYRVVGCTTSFEQTGASIAILRGVKHLSPTTLTVLGGANCEGEMGAGLAALTDAVDAVFGGESEHTFAELVELVRHDQPLTRRVWDGEPCRDLDALPTPDYADYYAQVRAFLPNSEVLAHARLSYETSRGCWWGAKSHCTFCGLNGQGMAPRVKSADRALSEIRTLLEAHPSREIAMTDNIMPHDYFRTFVPRLPEELPDVKLMYEVKANLTFRQVRALARGGVREIQPGIESLSTELLALMAKGTTCAQNVALLRFARMCGVRVLWNLLAGFPDDRRAYYEETRELLPLIAHLSPPSGVTRVIIDRFSPYHDAPERYGIRELRPLPAYRAWLPHDADVERIAYHFEGTFRSESVESPDLLAAMEREVRAWRERWIHGTRPHLVVRRIGALYELVDTRGLPGVPERQGIDEAQAVSALLPRSLRGRERAGDAWAREARVVVERDRKLVPLALSVPELYEELEARFGGSERVSLAVAS